MVVGVVFIITGVLRPSHHRAEEVEYQQLGQDEEVEQKRIVVNVLALFANGLYWK